MAEEVYRIDISVNFNDQYSREIRQAEREVTKFERSVERTERRLERTSKSRWRITLEAVDHASRVISRVGNFADRVARRSYRIGIRAVDMFTAPVRSMFQSVSGILATAGIVGGTAGGLVIPIKLQVERQNIETAFEVLLGSRQAAQQRVSELIEFAGQTPYTRDEIFQASRVLEVFTRGALSTGEGLRLIGDVAAGTQNDLENTAFWFGRLYDALESGRPVGEMLMRLQEMGALTGEGRARIEKLAESGKGISRIWPEVTKEFSKFDGMMEKMSNNLGNLLLSVKSFITNNILMRWGKGISSVLTPLLSDFRTWRRENSDLLEKLGNSIEVAGRKFAGFFDTLARGFGRNFSELVRMPEFQEADLLGKVKIAWDTLVTKPLEDWWYGRGQADVERLMGNIGGFMGSTLNSFITSALGLAGVDGSGVSGNVYKDIGTTAGKSFLEGFLDGLDTREISRKLWEAFKNIQPSFLGGQTESLGGSIAALLFDAWLISRITNILRGPFRAGRSVTRGGWSVLKDVYGWGRDARRGGPSGPLRGSPLNPNDPDPRRRSVPRWIPYLGLPSRDTWDRVRNIFRRGPRGPSGPTSLGFAGGRIPVAGPLLNMLSLVGTPQEQMPAAVGGTLGGMLGSALGATLGSIIPGIGTVIGGMAGGFLGSKIGGKIGGLVGQSDILSALDDLKNRVSSKFTEIKESAVAGLQGLPGLVAEQFGYMVGFVGEKMSQLPGLVGSWAAQTVSSIASWFSNLPGSVSTWWSGVYSSISSWAQLAYNSVTTWIGGIPNAIRSAFERAQAIWGNIRTWVSEKVEQLRSRFSAGQSQGQKSVRKYAQGGLISRPHIGLVGEDGPEMIIPLSPSRRNRGLELWIRAADYLGVRQYADGGIVSPITPVEPVAHNKSQGVMIDIGGITVQISTEKVDTQNIKDIVEEVADEVARKLIEAVSNTPIVST